MPRSSFDSPSPHRKKGDIPGHHMPPGKSTHDLNHGNPHDHKNFRAVSGIPNRKPKPS